MPGCKSGNKAPRHQFSKNPLRCEQWINNLNLDFLKNMCAQELSKYTVCYRHFCEQDYRCSSHRRILIDSAIPVCNPDNSDIIVDNEQQTLHVSEESDQRIDNPQSDLMDMAQIKQVQHNSEQLI